jgi:hypothetical protein
MLSLIEKHNAVIEARDQVQQRNTRTFYTHIVSFGFSFGFWKALLCL